LDDTNQSLENRHLALKCRNDRRIISEEFVDVIFEGSKTKAKKRVSDFTGVTSALVIITEGETLTIYLISTSFRKFNSSRVMSYWINDQLNDSGLPTLLEQAMTQEK
jgi:hypothetical protein